MFPPSHKVAVDSVMLSNSEKKNATKVLNFFPQVTRWRLICLKGCVQQLRKKIPVYPGAHYPKVRDHSMFMIRYVCKSK